MKLDLRTFIYIDILQPQLAAFIATVSQGYLPQVSQASLYVEVAPGIAINKVTDACIKRADVEPGLLIVERAYGLLEVHSDDQWAIRSAGEAALQVLEAEEDQRLKPRIVNSEIISAIDDYQIMLINRMRQGESMLTRDTLYIMECHPAGYAALAANEAEKAAPIRLLEVVSFGAFGRLWLAGGDAEIEEASRAVVHALGNVSGRPNEG